MLLTRTLVVALAVVSFGCSSGSTTDAAPADQRPAASAEDAVRQLLTAEQAGDHDTSFHLLSSAGLTAFPDVESWTRRRIELPDITAFRVESVDGDTVVTTVEHEPGLDPFVGLRAASETQRWHTTETTDGWLVEPEPEIEPHLPPPAEARDVAGGWAEAVQRCDRADAEALQVMPELLGLSSNATKLCGSDVAIETGRPTKVVPGPTVVDLTSQYGDAALDWARAVQVNDVTVLLAPIGTQWRVLGVVDA